MKNIYVIGVGLIGGSLALSLKSIESDIRIYGIDINKAHLSEALSLGIIDEVASLSTITAPDLIIVAIPVNHSLALIPKLLDDCNTETLIIDVGSTKSDICKRIENHKNRSNFMATHPIAGTEYTGPSAAFKELFVNKTNIVCEVENTAFKLQEKMLERFSKIGMRIRYMNPIAHDKHIAYVSHLSHISSFMLGKTVIEKEKNERDIFDLAGSGFESTVRLAKSSPEMWTPIFEHNKTNILETLDEYISNLKGFKSYLEKNDFEAVFNEMKSTNRIKDILNGIAKQTH